MRIVYLNPVGVLGGAERSLLDLLASVRKACPDFELTLIAGTEGPLLARAQELGVTARLLPMPRALVELGDSAARDTGPRSQPFARPSRVKLGWAAWRYARSLRRLLGDLAPDVIHSNGIKYHLLCRLGTPRGVPVVWHVRDYLGRRPMIGRALRWASRRAAGLIAISHSIEQDLQTLLPGVPVHVMYDGIDTDYFSPAQMPSPGASLETHAALVRVGLVATYARWKGHDVFIKAASQVLQRRPELRVTFSIVGGPIYRTSGSQFSEEELRALASSLGIAPRLSFVPFQEDIAATYRGLDVVVHCSTQPEPFGRTIVEAMACGRAVIATQTGGAAELFDDGRDAIGVWPGDPAALAEVILRLVVSPELRAQIAHAGRESALRRFGRQKLAEQVLAIYESLARSAIEGGDA